MGDGSHTLAVRARDAVGNVDPSPAIYSWVVDTVAPTISYTLNPMTPDGNNGWYTSDVSLTWWVIDSGSGLASTTGCDPVTVSTDQLATNYRCSARDFAGNTGGPVTATIKREATAPVVSLVGGPADTASYYYGAVPVAPTCAADDVTSGLVAACSVSGYSNEVGTHTVTATATDNAGNVASSSATFTVLAGRLTASTSPST